MLASFVTLYILSPIDLIPDFIPIIGTLDDIILIPLALILVIKMIPEPIMNECRHKAECELSDKKSSCSAS
nr:YkvA family protein [Methanolobus bombayensis]